MDFCCPICRAPLAVCDNLIKRCPLGHSFDRARAGYYNLLVGSGAGTHGDNREMVESRRDFLSRGFYEPLAERVAERVLEHLPYRGCLVDLGAGEGYYTDFAERALRERDGDTNVLAFDISKDAVKHLSRRNGNISAAVASCYSAPLSDGAADLALSIFSPAAIDEIQRILAPRAKFLMVFPDEMHLFSLKCAIYKTPYKNTPAPTELSGFKLLSDEKLEYSITLSSQDEIKSLFMMTPYAYRTSPDDKARLYTRESLTTEVAFRILVYEKN